jgi:hypothetical protein
VGEQRRIVFLIIVQQFIEEGEKLSATRMGHFLFFKKS